MSYLGNKGSSGGVGESFVGTGILAALDYVTTYTPSVPVLAAGLTIVFFPNVNNPANVTLNGVLMKEIEGGTLNNLEASDLIGGGAYSLIYNGTFWVVSGTASSVSGIPIWAASTVYVINQAVYKSGMILSKIAAGTSAATFTLAELNNWNVIANYTNIQTWTANTVYAQGTLLSNSTRIIKPINNLTSGGTFSNAEAANYTLVSNDTVGSFIATNYYYASEKIQADNALWQKNASGISGATFDVAEQANWTSLGGGGTTTVTTVTTNPSYANWGRTIEADASAASFSITLPTAVGFSGQLIEVKKIDTSTNTVTITPNGTQSIDAANSYVLSQFNDSVVLRSDGVGVKIVAVNSPVALTQTIIAAGITNTISSATVILVNGSASQTINLPNAAGVPNVSFLIKKINSTAISTTVTSTAGNFDGVGSLTILTQYDDVMLRSDGTNYQVVNKYTTVVAKDILPFWAASTFYTINDKVISPLGNVINKTASGTSAATFNTDATNWTVANTNGNIQVWQATTYYYAGDLVSQGTRVLRRTTSSISEATFTNTEATFFTLVTNEIISTYANNTYYYAGEQVRANGAIWAQKISGVSAAFFTGILNWDLISGNTSTQIVNGAYTVLETDDLILLPAGATFTITIPAARLNPTIKFATASLSATPPTIATSGGETIINPSTYGSVASFVQPGTTGLASSIYFQKVGTTWLFIS